MLFVVGRGKGQTLRSDRRSAVRRRYLQAGPFGQAISIEGEIQRMRSGGKLCADARFADPPAHPTIDRNSRGWPGGRWHGQSDRFPSIRASAARRPGAARGPAREEKRLCPNGPAGDCAPLHLPCLLKQRHLQVLLLPRWTSVPPWIDHRSGLLLTRHHAPDRSPPATRLRGRQGK